MELSVLERAVLIVLLGLGVWLFAKEFVRKIGLIRLGRPAKRWDNVGARIRVLVNEAILQRRVMGGRRAVGVLHALVFWGFLVSRLATVDHFTEGFGSPLLGHGSFHHGYALVMTATSLVVAAGVVVFIFRRFVLRPTPAGRASFPTEPDRPCCPTRSRAGPVSRASPRPLRRE